MKNLKNVFHLGTILILLGASFASAAPAHAASIITVNTTESSATTNGNCDIREAIQAADTELPVDACPAGSGTDTIAFNITGVAAQQTITLTSPLTVDSTVIIDGTTQPGYNGTPLIRLDGDGGPSSQAQLFLAAGAAGSTLKGLMFTNATWDAVWLEPGANNITISANYLNTDGVSELPAASNAGGVEIMQSNNVTVGGSSPADRNLVSGNNGVQIDGGSGNLVQGNYFGVRADGLTPITNQTSNSAAAAVYLEVNLGLIPANNIIRGNVMTGFGTGVTLTNQVNHTTVTGNTIGVGKDGSTDLALYNGIVLYGANNNTIGGSTPADRNVISGNTNDNIQVNNGAVYHSDNNLIFGNYIGTDAAGLNAVGSTTIGIHLLGGDGNQIGDSISGVGNLISGNNYQIDADTATNTVIWGNKLGTNVNGSAALGSPNSGVILGTASSARLTNNWIANNSSYSVWMGTTATITGASSNNCFINNGTSGLQNDNSTVADFSGNWWGAASGPMNSGNPAGSGDKVSDHVNYSAFLTAAPSICATGISLDTPALALGNQLVGTSGPIQTATLTNNAGKGLNFTSIITGAPYILDGTGTCPTGSGVLSPGASCTINVRFQPTVLGAVPGSVVITTDAPTSPLGITLSGTGVAGTQLLKNPSFEADANHDKKPDAWSFANFNLLTDKRDCTVRQSGKCSLKLVGNGKTKTAIQTITKSGLAGDDFAFSLFSKALKVPPAATYKLTVSFYNGASLLGSQSLNFTAGTHTFKQVKGTFTAPAAYTKVIYKITFKAASGTVWFDTASLTWAS